MEISLTRSHLTITATNGSERIACNTSIRLLDEKNEDIMKMKKRDNFCGYNRREYKENKE